jgi:tetratricopeptide (TPR) repeat protein
MSQIAVYCGWYDANVSGPFTRTNVEFMPGAFAYHLHSTSAMEIRNPSRFWVGPFLAKGATATMGAVDEPYLDGTPEVAVFVARWLYEGFTFGEAAYASQPVLSWQITFVGDPLYSPLRKSAETLHQQLTAQHNPLLEWSFLRLVNLNLARGRAPGIMANYLEQVPLLKQSAVLTEKLADIYDSLGKPSSALETYEAALQRHPSPEQRVRLRLILGQKLAAAGKDQEAFDDYAQLLHEMPDYPEPIDIYRQLHILAVKMGKKDEAAKYQDLIHQLTSPPAETGSK